MKKFELYTATILALGAVSIAVGADAVPDFPGAAGLSLGSASAASIETGGQGTVPAIERKVRLVASGIAPVNSCDAAYWPYYPADCLTQSDPAGL